MITRQTRAVAWLTLPLIALSACSSPTQPTTPTSGLAGGSGRVIVTDCGKELALLSQAKKMYASDGNIIVLTLAAGGAREITAISSIGRDVPILKTRYKIKIVGGLNDVSKDHPTLKSILANTPDPVVAGWNHGFFGSRGLILDIPSERGIPFYLLTESCRQEGTAKRDIVDPWGAVRIDTTNLGTITGHSDTTKTAVDDIDIRLKAVQEAAQLEEKSVAFLFDATKDNVLTSGKYGASQAITEAAGGANVTADIEDTWTNVNWERLVTTDPDVIVLAEYLVQSYQEKTDALKSHPATKDLTAVKEERFVNLLYAIRTESPLNVDAVEYLHKAFEKRGLAPASDVLTHPKMSTDLPGRGKLS